MYVTQSWASEYILIHIACWLLPAQLCYSDDGHSVKQSVTFFLRKESISPGKFIFAFMKQETIVVVVDEVMYSMVP